VHQWDIYKEYAEEESGSTANRTQFQKLFADAPSVSSTWCYSGTSTASAERVPCH
jgi:hypothetical protein